MFLFLLLQTLPRYNIGIMSFLNHFYYVELVLDSCFQAIEITGPMLAGAPSICTIYWIHSRRKESAVMAEDMLKLRAEFNKLLTQHIKSVSGCAKRH